MGVAAGLQGGKCHQLSALAWEPGVRMVLAFYCRSF